MKKPVILIGVGEMGAVFARGLLRTGYPVHPVNRDLNISQAAESVPNPEAVLVAVGESDLPQVLQTLPANWQKKLILLQNELLPKDFTAYPDPTVISVWFEKKKGQDSKVIIPSPAYGPMTELLKNALGSIDIPVSPLDNADQLEFELVVKNLYILTSNIAGIKTGGTVGELWSKHHDIANAVASDIIDLQEVLTGTHYDREALINAMLTAFDGDPDHQCMGRSAPARLARTLVHADKYDLAVPTLRDISASAT